MTANASQNKVDYESRVLGRNASEPQVLHTMLRVKDFDAALRFYVDGLGMKELYRVDVDIRRATTLFVGFDGASGGSLELVSYWDNDSPFSHGSGYGHVAIGVADVKAAVAKLEAMGTEISARPTVMVAGGPVCAFVKDPDGYAVELLQIGRN